jgi:hypothetical protein
MRHKLYIFDFDGTLMDTPLPETGKEEYFRITGQKYPHKGWWGRAESLHPGFNIQPFPEIVKEYERAKADAAGIVVLMTNRMVQHEHRVREILREHGLAFDVYSFKTGNSGKAGRTMHIINTHENEITYVEVWDDMEDQIVEFNKLPQMFEADIFLKINKVDNGRV